MITGDHSIVWPADASDPRASTLLTVADLIEGGGGDGLRHYVAQRLAVAAKAEADAPRMWAAFAVAHLQIHAGDTADGGVNVSAAALQMVLAYVAYLEAAAADRAPK